jgi:molybdopterin/thiamine biosynthesis adenylyltransferase
VGGDMSADYSYEEIFQRNIGVFTAEEQEKIKSLRIAIAGAGGLGGPVAYNLARLGVGEIRLADRDRFDVTNINRQFGAYVDTVGLNKAEAICSELKRINPFLKTVPINDFISAENVDGFLEDIDAVVDAIDFFEVDAELLLHRKAVEKGLWVFTSQAAKEKLTFTSFNPQNNNLRQMVTIFGKPNIVKAVKSFFPKLPEGITWLAVKELVKSGQVHISSHATPPNIGGGYLVEEMIRVLVRGKNPFAESPAIFEVDLDKMYIKKYE